MIRDPNVKTTHALYCLTIMSFLYLQKVKNMQAFQHQACIDYIVARPTNLYTVIIPIVQSLTVIELFFEYMK
jgi:hypothetical protein